MRRHQYEQLPPQPKKRNVVLIVAIIVILIILTIVFAFVILPLLSSNGEELPPAPSAPSAPSAPAGDYFWAFSPGNGYVNGKTFSEAQDYCSASGGELATPDDLMRAWEAGFQMCAYGWLSGGTSSFVMQGDHVGCGHDGYNTEGQPALSTRRGAYCVGPNEPEIYARLIDYNERFGNHRTIY